MVGREKPGTKGPKPKEFDKKVQTFSDPIKNDQLINGHASKCDGSLT